MSETIGRLAAVAMLMALLSACGLSIPVPSLMSEDVDATGTIPVLSEDPLNQQQLKSLDEEDWRRAKGAMALALDPQGAGTAVGWTNPDTQNRGTFTPLSGPTVEQDNICRTFSAEFTGKSGIHLFDGKACRISGEEWTVKTFAVRGPDHGTRTPASRSPGKPLDLRASKIY